MIVHETQIIHWSNGLYYYYERVLNVQTTALYFVATDVQLAIDNTI